MKTLLIHILAAALCAAVGTAPAAAQQKELHAAVAGERRRAAALEPGDEQAAYFDTLLTRAEAALAADRPFAALFYLQTPRVEMDASAYVASRRGAASATAGFEREWRATGREIASKERALAAPGLRLPRAVDALAEVSRVQARPYYEGGRLDGLNTTFPNGLYYVGLATANLDFARFCRTLPFPSVAPGPPLVPLSPELDRIDADVVAAYGRADADARDKFILVSADLKLARDLEERGWHEGALEKYLYAALSFRLLGAAPADPAVVEKARETEASARARLAAMPGDQSVGELFLELAEAALDRARMGDAKSAMTAVALVDDVLPRYFDYISRLER